MNKIKLIGIFCIFLIVSLPIATAQIVQPYQNPQNPYLDSSGNLLPGYTRDQYGNIVDLRTQQIMYSVSGYNPGSVTGSLDPRNYAGGVNDPNYIRDYYQRYGVNPSGYYSGSSQTGYGQQGSQYIPAWMGRDGRLASGYSINRNTGDILDPNGRIVATKAEVERVGGSVNVGAGEINFNLIGPTSNEQLRTGTTTGNLILNVNRYEPTVLTTNLVEEQNVPVYAFLTGSIATAPGVAPKISYMDVNVIGGDVQYVAGKPKYNPPIVYSLEDLGYIETWLQRIPKESQVPNKIDLTLQARVQFEGDSTVPIFGGEERKILQENRKTNIFERGGFADQDLRVFGGRAYVRAKYISDYRASFDVYTGDGVYIGEASASPGQETYPVSIVPGSNFIGDQLRIRVERIIGGNQNSVKFNVNGKDYIFNKGQEINVEKEVAGEDKRIKPIGWVVQDIFIPGSTSTGVLSNIAGGQQPTSDQQTKGYSFLILKQGSLSSNYYSTSTYPGSALGYVNPSSLDTSGPELILVYGNQGKSLSQQQLIDWYNGIIKNYDLLKSNTAISDELKKDLGFGDTNSQKYVMNIIMNIGKKDEIEKKVTDLIESLKNDFNVNEIPSFTLEKGSGTKATLKVGGNNIPLSEGQEIQGANQVSCTDKDKSYNCKVSSIRDDSIVLTYYERNALSGLCTDRRDEQLYLNAQAIEQQRFDRYINPVSGTQNVLPAQSGILYPISTNKCGGYVELVDIVSGRSVEVTILAGPPRGYAESVFNLHIPIEKRAIGNLSVDKLDEEINSTKKMIEDLTKTIDQLEKFVSAWMKVCLAISAWFTIEAFLVGLPKYKKDTSGTQASYTSEFKYDNGNEGFYTYDSYQAAVKDGKVDNNKLKNRINGIEEKGFYFKNDKGEKVNLDEKNNVGILYDNKGNTYEYDYFQKRMVPVKDMTGSEKGQIQVFTGGDGKKRLIITTDNLDDTKNFLKYYGGTRVPPNLDQYKKKYGDKGYYFVFEEGETLQLWHKNGDNIDFNNLQLGGNELRDQAVTEFPKTGGDAFSSIVYRGVEQNLGVVREAQLRGQSRVRFGGKNFQVNDRGRIDKTKTKCEDILGEGKCKLLFNACDPVVCPRSRCNLGGQYYATGPGGVIGSGLVGSLLLCLPNIKDGVLVPVCLSGILASLKGIRSHLQSYVKCLEASKTGQVSIGVCDKIRSIFICEFIWKEGIMLLNAKSGLINLANAQAGGGGEYFTQGVGGSIQEANEVVGFLVNDYAEDVLAAYKGKGLPEIGAEVCKASIAQRIPFIDALLGEASTPPDPPQFTAHFEESPYAPTLGKSRYQVYFHVYAGTPQREQALNWMVYLKSFGSSPMLRVGAGVLPAGESADETIDVIGDKGYQQICVVLNGLEQCGFGKIVSSDMFLSTLNDYITSQELGANIQTAAQCKSDPTSVVSTVGNRAILPGGPSVRRGCFASNPGLGIGQEKNWRRVGSCGSDKQGVSLGDCYEYADFSRYPNIENQVLELSCKESVCEANEECKGNTLYVTSRGKICCSGSCVVKGYVNEINNMANSFTGLSDSEKAAVEDTIRRDWSGGDIGVVGSSSGREVFRGPNGDEARYYAVLQICSGNVLPNSASALSNNPSLACQEVVKSVPDASKYYAIVHYILAKRYEGEGNKDKALQEYKIAINVKSNPLPTTEMGITKNKIDELTKELNKKPAEEKKKSDNLQRASKAKELNQEISSLIVEYFGFETAIQHLRDAQKQFTDILINQAEAAESNAQNYNIAVNNAVMRVNEIKIEQDPEYTDIIKDLNYIKGLVPSQLDAAQDAKVKTSINDLKTKLDRLKLKKVPDIKTRLDEISSRINSLPTDRDKAITLLGKLIDTDLAKLVQEPFNGLGNRISELKVVQSTTTRPSS